MHHLFTLFQFNYALYCSSFTSTSKFFFSSSTNSANNRSEITTSKPTTSCSCKNYLLVIKILTPAEKQVLDISKLPAYMVVKTVALLKDTPGFIAGTSLMVIKENFYTFEDNLRSFLKVLLRYFVSCLWLFFTFNLVSSGIITDFHSAVFIFLFTLCMCYVAFFYEG